MISRKNLIVNVGSNAVYLKKQAEYADIWKNYEKNDWTFEKLFVEIEYTNGRINVLNNEISLLVNKQYTINNTKKSLASYFESLSIEASTQRSTG